MNKTVTFERPVEAHLTVRCANGEEWEPSRFEADQADAEEAYDSCDCGIDETQTLHHATTCPYHQWACPPSAAAQASASGQRLSMQRAIGDWHRRRFPDAEASHVFFKAVEEMGEVAEALNYRAGAIPASAKPGGTVPEEAADVVVTLAVLVDRWFPGNDLFEQVERKLIVLTDPASGHRAAARAERSAP